MKISTKGRYAVRMLLDIAMHQKNEMISLRDIAERRQISKKYLEQIAAQLTQAGILTASRGQSGGYRLVGQPSDYTLDRILSVTEGRMHPVACLDTSPNQCARCDFCMTLPVWQRLDEVIHNYLASVTLQDILDQAPNQPKP